MCSRVVVVVDCSLNVVGCLLFAVCGFLFGCLGVGCFGLCILLVVVFCLLRVVCCLSFIELLLVFGVRCLLLCVVVCGVFYCVC